MAQRKSTPVSRRGRPQAVVRTTTAEALLGILSMEPMTGYQIRKTVEDSIGNFWSESFGQIYPALKRLVKDELAEIVAQRGAGETRGSKAYRLTAKGRRRVDAWLRTPSLEQVPRNEMLLKIFFAGRLGPQAAEAQVLAYHEMLRGRMAHFEAIRALFKTHYARFADAPYWRMTLEYGIAETEALQGWCERTLRQLRQMEEARDAG